MVARSDRSHHALERAEVGRTYGYWRRCLADDCPDITQLDELADALGAEPGARSTIASEPLCLRKASGEGQEFFQEQQAQACLPLPTYARSGIRLSKARIDCPLI